MESQPTTSPDGSNLRGNN